MAVYSNPVERLRALSAERNAAEHACRCFPHEDATLDNPTWVKALMRYEVAKARYEEFRDGLMTGQRRTTKRLNREYRPYVEACVDAGLC